MILYNTDSLQYMKGVENNKFQAIITDPPYDFDRKTMEEFHNEMRRVCSGDMLIFCPPENLWNFDGVKWLFWVKTPSTKNFSRNYGRFVEMIAWYPSPKSKFNTDLHWSNYTGIYDDKILQKGGHPFRKPESLLERFVLIHTDPYDNIFDPFTGSGTVPLVAERHNRACLGIEITGGFQ